MILFFLIVFVILLIILLGNYGWKLQKWSGGWGWARNFGAGGATKISLSISGCVSSFLSNWRGSRRIVWGLGEIPSLVDRTDNYLGALYLLINFSLWSPLILKQPELGSRRISLFWVGSEGFKLSICLNWYWDIMPKFWICIWDIKLL